MINLELTNTEAIALEQLLAFCRDFPLQVPIKITNEENLGQILIASSVNKGVVSCHEKLKAELDNQLQTQRLTQVVQ